MLFGLVVISLMGFAISEDPHQKHQYKAPPKPYQFNYGVKDDYSGADFTQNEHSDGNRVIGSYTVQLPDGRRQTVTYEADHDRGFIAKVSYEGEAKYPSHGAEAIT